MTITKINYKKEIKQLRNKVSKKFKNSIYSDQICFGGDQGISEYYAKFKDRFALMNDGDNRYIYAHMDPLTIENFILNESGVDVNNVDNLEWTHNTRALLRELVWVTDNGYSVVYINSDGNEEEVNHE